MDSQKYIKFLYGSKKDDLSYTYDHISHIVDAPQPMRIKPLPEKYEGTVLGDYLLSHSIDPNGVYQHQAIAAEESGKGNNVVLCTTTGSGKSRAFMTAAFDLVMSDPTAKVLVLYPLVQLNKDQTLKWKEMADGLDLEEGTIGTMYGAIPMEERPGIIKESRILLATPDIVHRYMMTNLDKPEVTDFLKNRRLTVLDELDTYHAGFGSNMAFLLRRMQFIQQTMGGDFSKHQYIGASATLPNPQEFFKGLTGQDVVNIPEKFNGAPRLERTIIHHGLPLFGHDKLLEAESIILRMLGNKKIGQGIVFLDSRAKVENLAALINQNFGEDVAIVQKAGLNPEDQSVIDHKMLTGQARVVIATSSMESGVDHDFQWGMNVGVPAALTSLKQRIGRVGRKQNGLFIVLAPRHAMGFHSENDDNDYYSNRDKKSTLERYLRHTPLEEPQLYLENEFIQIAQGLCLNAEIRQLRKAGITLSPSPKDQQVKWPPGFLMQVKLTRDPEENLTGEKRILLPPKNTKQPVHHFHTLRNINGSSMLLINPNPNLRNRYIMGSVQIDQAIREFPPGSIAWHGQKQWRVWSWKDSKIVMSEYKGTHQTKHNVNSFMRINIANDNLPSDSVQIAPQELQQNSEEGFHKALMTLVKGGMTQTITSFVEWDKKDREDTHVYRFKDDHELTKGDADKNMIDYGPKRRSSISTTGLLLHIPSIQDNWTPARIKGLYDEVLNEFCEAMSYERHSLDCTNKGYAAFEDNTLIKGAYYFYDTTPGSLGLAHGLMHDPNHNIAKIVQKIKDRTPERRRNHRELCDTILNTLKDMKPVQVHELSGENKLKPIEPPPGHILMIAPDECGLYKENNTGSLKKVKIKKPVIIGETPGYRIETFNRKAAFKSSEYVTYNKKTGEFYIPDSVKKKQNPSATHFVSADFITATDTKVVAMHKETGKLKMLSTKREGTWIAYKKSSPK